MKPIGSTWKRLILEYDDVWEVVSHDDKFHRCRCIVAGRDTKVGQMASFYIFDGSEIWEPYETKSNNFKLIYDILNEN